MTTPWMTRLLPLGGEVTPTAAAATMDLVAEQLVHPIPDGGTVQHDLPYGAHPLQRMDLYRGPGTAAPRGALVFVHGGGFVAGDKRERDPFYANLGWWAVAQGWIGITLNHRLAPEHPWPQAIDDLDLALQAVVERAPAWGIDPANVCLLGHSAGAAHVAGWLARHRVSPVTRPTVARAVLVSGLYDLTAMRLTPGRAAYFGTDAAELATRSPAGALTRSRVPLVLAVAEHDPPEMIAQAQAQHRRCEAAGAPAALVMLPGHNHFSTVLALGAEPSALDDAVFAPRGTA